MTNSIQPGYQFTLRRDVDRFPDFVARKGMTGTVVSVLQDGTIAARMDQHLDGAEEWDNEIWWQPDRHEEFLADTAPLSGDTDSRPSMSR